MPLILKYTPLYIVMAKYIKQLSKMFIDSKTIVISLLLFGSLQCASSQADSVMQKINLLEKNDFNSYVEFFSTDITDYFNPEKSNPYPSTNLFDGYLKTCWVAGSAKQSEKPTLYIKTPENISIDNLILNIFSGYGKSKSLYMKNARPKIIKVSIFVAYNPEGYDTEVAVKYLIKKYTIERYIRLDDTFGVQSFPLNLNKKDLIDFQNKNLKNCKSSLENDDVKINLSFILKFDITDIYKGSKYDDICISEIFFNNRFVTAYPDKYNQINNVYIQDENTLVADYSDKKGVNIYKDTTSIFTMVDWEEYLNWAILHYVKNDDVGQNSRIEESYLLIDLKNRKIVNDNLKKCTGIYNTPFIIRDKTGKVFLDAFDKYKVELK